MKVENMTGRNGRAVPNQFIIFTPEATYFQSYKTIIVKTVAAGADRKRQVFLDRNAWDYSRTTSRYRNAFLGETTVQIKAKIVAGEYILEDLNG